MLPFACGIPSHDTINDVMNALDGDLFSEAFAARVGGLREDTPDIVAIDGKTSRRVKAGGWHPLHVVPAWAARQRLVLGQQTTEKKYNDINATPLLLERLQLAGALVTIDAMGTRTKIAETILAYRANYLLALKDNQRSLACEVALFFDSAEARALPLHETTDADHGRIETRRHRVSHDVAWLNGDRRTPGEPHFPGLKAIAMVEAEVERNGQATTAHRFFLALAPLLARTVRAHWGIENHLHWVLDVLRRGNAPVGAVEEVVSARCSGWPGRAIFDDRADRRHQGRRQLFEVHCDGGQQGLDLHVFEPPPDRSCKAVERLGGAMRAFDLPSVTGVDRVFVFTPCRALAPGAQDGCVGCHDVHPAGRGALRQTLCLERTTRAVAPVRAIPSTRFRAVSGGQALPYRAPDHIVMGIGLEPPGWKALRPLTAGRAKRRDDGFGLAVFRGGADPPHATDRVRRDPARCNPEGIFDGVEARLEPARVVLFASHDFHVNHDSRKVVHCRVLFVGRAQRGLGRRRHGRVRVRAAEFLEPAARARVPLGVVGILDRIEMAQDQRIHADMRPDQTGVDVNGLGRNQSGQPALLHDTDKDPAKDIFAPALPDAGQRGMIRQSFVQGVAREPTDREIDLRLTHQSPVMDDAQQEPRQHQAHGDLGIDARPAIVGAAKPGNLAWQPAQIKNAINPHQNMVVGEKVSQRPSDEQFQLTAFLPTRHCRLSITDKRSESET